jgi:pimeloyl-ACP methyl ester carboxylesterase
MRGLSPRRLAHAHMLAQGIPGAQLRIVDGAGHALLWTHPDVMIHTTETFLATVHGAEQI